MSRIERIRAALIAELNPQRLAVTDDSRAHAGHAGARDGRGHFSVEIVAAAFEGLAPLARHRRVYEVLEAMLATDIHALAIKARTPREAGL